MLLSFDNHFDQMKEDLECACFEVVDGRMIFESYSGHGDSHCFNYCPFCGYKGSVEYEN